MSTFASVEFDALTDPDRPVLGEVIDREGVNYVVAEVDWVMSSKLMEEVIKGIAPSIIMAEKGYDLVITRFHNLRPFVSWLVYLNKQT